jgi:hypothetical protein
MAKVECRSKIADNGGTPRSDVAFAPLGETEAGLDEADKRRMIEYLRVDPSPRTPGGNDQHGHTHAETVGSCHKSRIPGEYLVGDFHGG